MHTETPTQKRYTPDNEPSWVRPSWIRRNLCTTHTIEYSSKDRNEKAEPVFYKNGQQSYLIQPIIKPRLHIFKHKLRGFFTAYPAGLSIDENTGEIDINASDTGFKYTVQFTPFGKNCVAKTNIVIGGIAYSGGIFSLYNPREYTNAPVLFGDASINNLPLKGRFFFTPPDVRETADLQGLVIDKETGEIKLKDTIMSGGLGFRKNGDLPENGTSKEFTIYYQLELNNSKIENILKTSVQIYFFDKKEDIPDELLTRLNLQRYLIRRNVLPLPLLLASSLSLLPESPWGALGALVLSLSTFLFLNEGGQTTPHRPPVHCVTGN